MISRSIVRLASMMVPAAAILAAGVSPLRAQQAPADAAAPAPAPATPPPVTDPVVLSLLETNPTTPRELLRVALVAIDLGSPQAARPLIKRVIDANLDDAALAALAEQFGSATFLRISLAEGVQPEAAQLADAVLAAADRQARDPERIATLVDQLRDAATRPAAIQRLRAGRDAAAIALIDVLADPARSEEHPGARVALVALGRDALPLLIAVLRTADPALQVQAASVLGRIGRVEAALDLFSPALSPQSPSQVRQVASRALARLAGEVPSPAEAAATLYHSARRHLAQQEPLETDPSGQMTRWRWDSAQQQLAAEAAAPFQVSLEIAAGRAHDALELAPNSREAGRLYLAALLEAASHQVGLDQPLPQGPGTARDLVADSGIDVVEDLLEFASAEGYTAAATAAARILGQIGKPELLYRRSPRASVLVEAARHSDRRLRFAAIEAILLLKPIEPYPGSSFVTDSLGFFASSWGAPQALVADMRPTEVQRQAGLLAEMGYETEIAGSAREVLSLAPASSDFELLLIDYTLAGHTSGQLLQQLRHDSRTANLPIGVVASSEDLERTRHLVRLDPLTDAFVRPLDRPSMEFQVDSLLARLGHKAVPSAVRARQAEQALAWLAELSSAAPDLYQLRRIEPSITQALWVPELSSHAATVLARLGTATGQQLLVDLASQSIQPIALREAAAKAFAESVAQFGTLLTTPQILLQYDRYNESETQDESTQAVLASILDTIEARAAADGL